MIINEHRKAIVRVLIAGCDKLRVSDRAGSFSAAFTVIGEAPMEDKQHQSQQADNCVATGLYFPHTLSQMQITWSNVGPLFMGLWLDEPLVLHDGENEVSLALAGGWEETGEDVGSPYHGNTLFPRWLAEVLNEMCDLDISEDDIYDTKE